MDNVDPITFPHPADTAHLAGSNEVDAAIEMVRLGAARRMRLVGMADADGLAAVALARAQAAGITFRLERDRGSVILTFEEPDIAEPAPGHGSGG